MQAGSFDRRCRRVTRGIVLLAAAAGLFAAQSAMAQVIDPAPTADAGGPYTVAAGGSVQLSGTFSGAPVISPNVVLALQPYLTVTGATYDPSWVSFTNTGGGQYTLTLVGVPEPAVPPATPIQVRSNLGGVSPPFGLDTPIVRDPRRPLRTR